LKIEYIELLREDGIIPAARIIGEILLKLDKNNGCRFCMICICCDGEYQFVIEEIIFC
jgi:hypothetical protein